MSSRKTHVFAGVMTGGAAAALIAMKSKEEPHVVALRAIGGIVGGAHGGVLPDVLDPADTPRHRGFGHSVALVGAAATFIGQNRASFAEVMEHARTIRGLMEVETVPWKRLALGFAYFASEVAIGYSMGVVAGYGSHLVLDAATPQMLPLLNSSF